GVAEALPYEFHLGSPLSQTPEPEQHLSAEAAARSQVGPPNFAAVQPDVPLSSAIVGELHIDDDQPLAIRDIVDTEAVKIGRFRDIGCDVACGASQVLEALLLADAVNE